MGCSKNSEINPLLADSTAPYGVPMFDKIELEHYVPAFEKAIEMARAEVDSIATNKEEATFENSIVALENSGEKLSQISEIFFNLNSCNTSDKMQQIALEVTPILTKFSNDVSLNQQLFKRVKGGYENAKKRGLTGEDFRLAQQSYRGFVRGGAELSEDKKSRFRELSNSLSELSLKFEQNLLAATNDYTLNITDSANLSGLPSFVVEAAADCANEQGKEGWSFTLHFPSYLPFMQYSENRALREEMWRAYSSRAYKSKYSNEEIIKEIAAGRIEKANLLGYENHAAYILEKNMAKSGDEVLKFASELNEKALPYAQKEVAEIEKYAKESCGFDGEKLEPWDFSFYSEKFKKEKFDLSDELLKPYFKLENVEKGVFSLFNKLYGVEFEQCDSLPLYHPDAKAYRVKDEKGEIIALFYIDFFPRESKRSGAWMTSFREQSYENGKRVLPIVSVVCNFTKPTSSTPSLLTFGEVTTLLHEMGHAMHGIFADGKYGSMSGTNVARDFVELPSQIMENWAYEPQFLSLFAKHYQTGEDIPMEYIKRIEDARYFLECYSTTRQLSFVFTDMAWHTLTKPIEIGAEKFEKEAIKATQVLPQKEGACHSTSFSHIFAGGYSSGYYSYKWAELLEADGFKLFKENGVFDKKTAALFKDNILSKGDSAEPMELYVNFRGAKPNSNSLIEKMGIEVKS